MAGISILLIIGGIFIVAIVSAMVATLSGNASKYVADRMGILGENIYFQLEDGTEARGVYIANVTMKGTAQKSGLQVGDIIFSVNQIRAEDLKQLKECLKMYHGVTEVTLQILKKDADGGYRREEQAVMVDVPVGKLKIACGLSLAYMALSALFAINIFLHVEISEIFGGYAVLFSVLANLYLGLQGVVCYFSCKMVRTRQYMPSLRWMIVGLLLLDVFASNLGAAGFGIALIAWALSIFTHAFLWASVNKMK